LLLFIRLIVQAQPAADTLIETQHAIEAGLPITPKLHLTLHSRGRTQPSGLGAYQLRAGPILKYALSHSASLLAGYYFSAQQRAERDVRGAHRYFGGVEFSVVEKPTLEIELRALAERFVVTGADFTRSRNRIRLTSTRSAAPYTSGEWFFDRKGLRSVRYSGGFRWRYSRQIEIDVGYFYEPRRNDLGPNRHMFLTSIHFRLKSGKRPDPDI
jgi:hypothetical protein